MFLVLCDAGDVPALWGYRRLHARLGDELQLVSEQLLAFAIRWEHRVGSNGVSSVVTLADGRVIRSEDVRGTLNRLQYIASVPPGVAASDHEYAEAEMQALFASWLHSLPPPILNHATPAGLSGSLWRHHSESLALAVRAGFDIVPYEESDAADPSAIGEPRYRLRRDAIRVLVIGGEVVGPEVAPAVAEACVAYATLADTALVEIELTRGSSDTLLFRCANALPDLRIGGSRGIDALQALLFGGTP